MRNKIIITGATGYIGSNLIKRLIIDENEIHILVRPTSKYNLIEEYKTKINIHIYDGSILELDNIFKKVKPDGVIHLASLFIVQHHQEDIEGLIESNIIFGTQLLEMCKKNSVKYFVNVGTYWQNYLGNEYNPVNLYAATKQAFEDILKYYIETSSMRAITLRLMDTYGPNDPRRKIMNLIKEADETNEVLEMSGGEQEIGLVYIDDVIKAFERAISEVQRLDFGTHKIYIVAPYERNTLRQVVSVFEKEINRKINIQWGKKQYREREVMKLTMDLPNILGEQEVMPLEKGIRKLLSKERE